MFSFSFRSDNGKGVAVEEECIRNSTGGARSFTFKELAIATRNFKEVNLIGEGGFGRVFKGRLESGQVI